MLFRSRVPPASDVAKGASGPTKQDLVPVASGGDIKHWTLQGGMRDLKVDGVYLDIKDLHHFYAHVPLTIHTQLVTYNLISK